MKISYVIHINFITTASALLSGITSGRHFDQQRRADVPFFCDSYRYISGSLNLRQDVNETRKYTQMLADDTVTKTELVNLLKSTCL